MEQKELINPAVIVSQQERVLNKDNFEKKYLVLEVMVSRETDDEFKDFYVIEGRKTAYEHFKPLIESGDIDVINTKLLAFGGKLGSQEINLGNFMRVMKDRFFIDDSWDINDFISHEEYCDPSLNLLER